MQLFNNGSIQTAYKQAKSFITYFAGNRTYGTVEMINQVILNSNILASRLPFKTDYNVIDNSTGFSLANTGGSVADCSCADCCPTPPATADPGCVNGSCSGCTGTTSGFYKCSSAVPTAINVSPGVYTIQINSNLFSSASSLYVGNLQDGTNIVSLTKAGDLYTITIGNTSGPITPFPLDGAIIYTTIYPL